MITNTMTVYCSLYLETSQQWVGGTVEGRSCGVNTAKNFWAATQSTSLWLHEEKGHFITLESSSLSPRLWRRRSLRLIQNGSTRTPPGPHPTTGRISEYLVTESHKILFSEWIISCKVAGGKEVAMGVGTDCLSLSAQQFLVPSSLSGMSLSALCPFVQRVRRTVRPSGHAN